jgi:hypothetical protein
MIASGAGLRGGVVIAAVVAGIASIMACRDDRNLVTIDGPPPIIAFQINAPAGEVLWRIEAVRPVVLSGIHYGAIPDGFIQRIPAAGTKPRAMIPGEHVAVVIVAPDYIYRHEGVATRGAGFRGGFGETAPFSPAARARAFEGSRITEDLPMPPTMTH